MKINARVEHSLSILLLVRLFETIPVHSAQSTNTTYTGGLDQDEIVFLAVQECFNAGSKLLSRSSSELGLPELNYRNNDPHIVFNSPVVDDFDIQQILILTECVKSLSRDHVQDRRDFNNDEYGGGNNVTFVGGFFQRILPNIFSRMKDNFDMAAEYAGWRPYPRHLGVRCIETLEYIESGELIYHEDSESIYTTSILLVDPSEFTGGEFMIQTIRDDNSSAIMFKPNKKGTGVFFDSMSYHGIEKVMSGRRVVLVMELWELMDGGFRTRPSPDDIDFSPAKLVMLDQAHHKDQETIVNSDYFGVVKMYKSLKTTIINILTQFGITHHINMIIGGIFGIFLGLLVGLAIVGDVFLRKPVSRKSVQEDKKHV
mmetsp:Transcript_36138/g.36813  ORF Transcript_36138/g.36813 Transcript_36138/m.36813 type:complete len:371 (+) Transcript_36138:50-1162(+)